MARRGRQGRVGIWVLAVIITLAAVVYQRMIGPTRPVRGHVELGETRFRYTLVRTTDAPGDYTVRLGPVPAGTEGMIVLRRHPSDDPWTARPLSRDGDFLTGALPHQPPAGKVAYQIFLRPPGGEPLPSEPRTAGSLEEAAPSGAMAVPPGGPVVIRFRGAVPVWIILPHVLLMFLGMLWSNRAGLEALRSGSGLRRLSVWAFSILFVGGMILGPFVQWYSFGKFWTGVPFGYDLTDNKTLISIVAWAAALIIGMRAARKARRRGTDPARAWQGPAVNRAVLVASLVTLIIFSIPHSVLGSELKHAPAAAGMLFLLAARGLRFGARPGRKTTRDEGVPREGER